MDELYFVTDQLWAVVQNANEGMLTLYVIYIPVRRGNSQQHVLEKNGEKKISEDNKMV